jgi:hypothetical protein
LAAAFPTTAATLRSTTATHATALSTATTTALRSAAATHPAALAAATTLATTALTTTALAAAFPTTAARIAATTAGGESFDVTVLFRADALDAAAKGTTLRTGAAEATRRSTA